MSADALTPAELDHAREIVKTRWTRESVRELHDLPREEQEVVGALAGLLDAEPVDPVTLEPLRERERRCVLCGESRFPMRRAPSGELVCSFRPACAYRERVRAGMPKWKALRLLEADKAAMR